MAPITATAAAAAASAATSSISPHRLRNNNGKHKHQSLLQRLGIVGGILVLFLVTFTMFLHSSSSDMDFQTFQLSDQTIVTIQSPGKAVVRIAQEGDTVITVSSAGGGAADGSGGDTIIKTNELPYLESGATDSTPTISRRAKSTFNNKAAAASMLRHNPQTSKQDFIVPKRINRQQNQGNKMAADLPPPPPEEEAPQSDNNDDEDNHSEDHAPKPPNDDETNNDSDSPSAKKGVVAAALITTNQLQSGLPITATNHMHEFRESLDRETAFRGQETVCLPWDINADEWWTHHPGWEMGPENATHYCFSKIQNPEKAKLFKDIYQVQFNGDCSLTHTKRMWNSGWSADLTNQIDGLKHAVKDRHPVQVVEKPWHYADPASAKPTKDNRHVPPACPRGNMFCYFLPFSACPPADDGGKEQFLEDNTKRGQKGKREHQWYYEYVTRRQTWLRKRVHDYLRKQNIHGPCTAIHCRRGDVVLHTGMHKRRYHPIAEYINATDNLRPNIYLMTDDANAIVEAKTEFPHLNWMYIDKPRYKSSEGGWEKQIPSNDPTFEVTALLSEFQAVRACDQLIHSRSGFATQLYQEMVAAGTTVDRIDLDKGGKVFSTQYKDSVNISAAYDADQVLLKNNNNNDNEEQQ